MAQSLPIPFYESCSDRTFTSESPVHTRCDWFYHYILIDQLAKSDQLDVLEVGSGTGNLAETIVNNSRLTIDYLGLEVDDLLIDLSASIADVMESSVVFAQGDAVRPQVLKESDLIVSDLPIGYYPDDEIAQRYQVASSEAIPMPIIS